MQDKIGQELKPGVWIFYGHNIGRCAGLRLGKVLDVKAGPANERCPWITDDRVTVWSLDDDHLDYYKYHKDEPHSDWARPKPLSKKSTLLFSNRCVVVPEEFIPEHYRKLIEEAISGKIRSKH